MAGPDLLTRIDRAIVELQAIRDELAASMRASVLQLRIEKQPSIIWRDIEFLDINGVAANCVGGRLNHKVRTLLHAPIARRGPGGRPDCLSDTDDRHA